MGWDYIAGRKVRRKTTGHKSSIGTDVTVADVLRLLLFAFEERSLHAFEEEERSRRSRSLDDSSDARRVSRRGRGGNP